MKKRIIVYHDNLFGQSIGSTEKLLQDFIRILSSAEAYEIFAVYGKNNGEAIPTDLLTSPQCKFLAFTHSQRETEEPFRCLDMIPDFKTILSNINPNVFITTVWADKQFPVIDIPPRIPLFLVSPFGAYCSNGNVRKLYISGAKGVFQSKKAGIWFAEILFNPLKVPPLNDKKCQSKSKSDQIIFGRSGRPDPNIFDPISLLAFAKLEKEYQNKVKYIYVNPSPKARELVKELKLQQVEFREWLSDQELQSFYQEIDVFAHARADGETFGVAIAEAMLAQNPVISHVSRYNNEHMFFLKEPFGKVAGIDQSEQYFEFMKFFVDHRERLPELGKQARDFTIPYLDQEIISKKILKDMAETVLYEGKPRFVFDHVYQGSQRVKKTVKKLLSKNK